MSDLKIVRANEEAERYHRLAGHAGDWRSCSGLACRDAQRFVPELPTASILSGPWPQAGGSGADPGTRFTTTSADDLDPRALA